MFLFVVITAALLTWLAWRYVEGKPMQNAAFANGIWWFLNVSLYLMGHTFDNPLVM